MKEKLRVGLLVDDFNIPAWAYRMLERIKAEGFADITLIIKRDTPKPVETKLNKFRKAFPYLLYLQYRKFDKRFFKTKHNAFAKKDVRQLTDCKILPVTTFQTKHTDRFTDADLNNIRNEEPDVLLRLGFKILKGEVLNVARYGIWSFHHGDNRRNRGMPAGLWEVMNEWDETGVILQVLTEDLDAGHVLARSYSSTDDFSVERNLNNYYWKSLSLVPRKLKELYQLGGERFFEKVENENRHPEFYSNQLFTVPKNGALLVAIGRKIARKLKQKVSDLFYFNQWRLLYQLNKKGEMSRSFYRFKKLLPPKDRFWADPHAIKRGDSHYIFLEELPYNTMKGHISVIEIDATGKAGPSEIVLTKDYHLSYPFLFEDNGDLYMIPETKANKTIELYRCTSFPHQWELAKIIKKDLEAVDTTIHKQDGKYWMFVNIRENPGASTMDELFLFYSDSLLGDNWIPHPKNPIVSDVTSARPAGRLFYHHGQLYRPSQNSGKRYGYGMRICRVDVLSETDFQEVIVDSIYPNWDKDLLATHSLSHHSNLTVIDGLYRVRK